MHAFVGRISQFQVEHNSANLHCLDQASPDALRAATSWIRALISSHSRSCWTGPTTVDVVVDGSGDKAYHLASYRIRHRTHCLTFLHRRLHRATPRADCHLRRTLFAVCERVMLGLSTRGITALTGDVYYVGSDKHIYRSSQDHRFN